MKEKKQKLYEPEIYSVELNVICFSVTYNNVNFRIPAQPQFIGWRARMRIIVVNEKTKYDINYVINASVQPEIIFLQFTIVFRCI